MIQHRPQKYKRRRAKAVSDSGRICIRIDLRKILQKTRANKHANKHELFSAFDAEAPGSRFPIFSFFAAICRKWPHATWHSSKIFAVLFVFLIYKSGL